MINYFEGTVFNTNAQALVNTVNCVGVMGAGIALEFMLRYPDMFENYQSKCEEKKIIIGKMDYYKSKANEIIVNFPTKWHFKYPSKLAWIEQGLQDFVKTYKNHDIKSIAFPKLGTSNGGLNWPDVKTLMEKILLDTDIDIYICLDNKKDADGVEKIMLDNFNTMDIDNLAKITRLTAKQRFIIQNHRPYDRFWKFAESESIGIKTYSSIFKHFYSLATGETNEFKQLSLFE